MRPKVFVVGRNKTGTRSVRFALMELDYRMPQLKRTEPMLLQWAVGDFDPLIELCKSYDAFQDIPFGLSYTYRAVDDAFPGSKFILTVRDSPAQWYKSLTRWVTQLWGRDGRLPTADDLRRAPYGRKYAGPGWVLRAMSLVYGYPEVPLWDEKAYTAQYQRHNRDVQQYFAHRPDDLLVLNVAEGDAYVPLCKFLGREHPGKPLPWENKSDEIPGLVAKLFGLAEDQVDDSLRMRDVDAWDSLRHMELVLVIEETYGVELTFDEIVAMSSVGGIRRVLQKRGLGV